MKTSKLLIIALFSAILFSCSDAGTTQQRLNGDESTLPEELKGLKVYTVSTGGISEVKVAVLNGQVNSATYMVGKVEETTIVVNKGEYNERTIYVKEILSENDSIIVIRKK